MYVVTKLIQESRIVELIHNKVDRFVHLLYAFNSKSPKRFWPYCQQTLNSELSHLNLYVQVVKFQSIRTAKKIYSKYSIYTKFTSLHIEKSSKMVENDVKPCLEIKRWVSFLSHNRSNKEAMVGESGQNISFRRL